MKSNLHFIALLQTMVLWFCLPAQAQSDGPVTITVDARTTIAELRPIWNYFGYDEALTTLTPEGRHLLNELTQMSAPEPIQVRVHHAIGSP